MARRFHDGSSILYMPDEMLKQKYETSDRVLKMDMDKNFMNNYNRAVLLDARPDKPVTEAEEVKRYDSRYIMALRETGGRSKAEPYRPDEFYEDTTWDPRQSAMNDPSAKRITEQRKSRGRFMKKLDDDTRSVHEGPISEREFSNIRDGLFDRIKNKLPWFSTSKSMSYGAGRGLIKSDRDVNGRANIVQDGIIYDLGDKHMHRRDHSDLISDTTPVGWYTTSDHEFGMAAYNRRPLAGNTETDFTKNKYAATLDGIILTNDDKTMLKKLGYLGEIKRAMTENTSIPSAQQILEDEDACGNRSRGIMGNHGEVLNVNSTLFDQELINSMVNASRKCEVGNNKDALQYEVIGSMKPTEHSINTRQNSTSGATHFLGGGKDKNKTMITSKRPENHEVFNYKAAERYDTRKKNNTVVDRPLFQPLLNGEQAVRKSADKTNGPRKQLVGDMKVREFNSGKTRVGHMEKSSKTRKMVVDGHTKNNSHWG